MTVKKTIPNLDEKTEFLGTEKTPIDTGTQTFAVVLSDFRTSLNEDLQAFCASLDSLVTELEV